MTTALGCFLISGLYCSLFRLCIVYILIPYKIRAIFQVVQLVIRGLLGFDWDLANWRKSELKHGVAAGEAEEALRNDPLCQVDERHSDEEQRYVALGVTNEGRRLFVSFTVWRNRVRAISARPMSRKERVIYEAAQQEKLRRGRR